MFIAANNNMSATVHHIIELCERRGERAYRANQANNFNVKTKGTPLWGTHRLKVLKQL